jgi:hypothetical protein
MGQPARGITPERPAGNPLRRAGTEGTEPSQYLEERKSTETPLVVASERGTAQTYPTEWPAGLCRVGVGSGGRRSRGCARKLPNLALAEVLWDEPPEKVKAR